MVRRAWARRLTITSSGTCVEFALRPVLKDLQRNYLSGAELAFGGTDAITLFLASVLAGRFNIRATAAKPTTLDLVQPGAGF